jgi:hypothetical protein
MARKNAGTNGSGNIPADAKTEVAEEFSAGDVVRLKTSALMNGDLDMTPLSMFRIGHPNEFLVVEAFEHKKLGPCVTLRQCCYLYQDHSSGIKLCKGHQAIFFEKMRRERARQKGDRMASVKIPWVGEVAAFEYEEDPENPKARFRIAGKECELEGAPAKFFKSVIEGYGFQL